MADIYQTARDMLRVAMGPQVLNLDAIADAIEQMITDRLSGFQGGGTVPANALTWGGETLTWGGQTLTWGP